MELFSWLSAKEREGKVRKVNVKCKREEKDDMILIRWVTFLHSTQNKEIKQNVHECTCTVDFGPSGLMFVFPSFQCCLWETYPNPFNLPLKSAGWCFCFHSLCITCISEQENRSIVHCTQTQKHSWDKHTCSQLLTHRGSLCFLTPGRCKWCKEGKGIGEQNHSKMLTHEGCHKDPLTGWQTGWDLYQEHVTCLLQFIWHSEHIERPCLFVAKMCRNVSYKKGVRLPK